MCEDLPKICLLCGNARVHRKHSGRFQCCKHNKWTYSHDTCPEWNVPLNEAARNFLESWDKFVARQKMPPLEIEKAVGENLSKYYDEDIFIDKTNKPV